MIRGDTHKPASVFICVTGSLELKKYIDTRFINEALNESK